MGIIDDSVELLAFIYRKYVADQRQISSQDKIDEFEWESGRINRTIDYLDDLELIKINKSVGNIEGVYNFVITGLTPNGIKTIEDENEFKDIFGIEVGIPGVIKAIWTKEER